MSVSENETVVPLLPGAAPRVEAIPATSSEVFSEVHDNTLRNFRLGQAPRPRLPSFWQLAHHVVNERGILRLYRYDEEE